MNDWKTPKDWYSIDLEKRKEWYNNIGEDYDKTRPSYEPELIQWIINTLQLNEQNQLLEIGCGTGKATLTFSQLNCSLVGLEPNPDFYVIAQKNCSTYPKINLKATSFEEWQPKGQLFDGVIAANVFHWLPPQISYPKSYQILKEKGHLILLWNLSLQPTWDIYQTLQPIYQTYAPTLDKYETIEQQKMVIKQFGNLVLESQQFHHLQDKQKVCRVIYSVDDYLTLLSTYSPYIALKADIRQSLFEELRQQLMIITDGMLSLTYLAAAQIAQKLGC